MRTRLQLSPAQTACALLVAVLALAIGWTVSGLEEIWPSVILALSLSWLSLIDIDRFLLPDVMTLGLLLCGLGFGAFVGLNEFTARLIGAVVGYAVLAGTGYLYKRFRGMDGLGGGDAKLLAAGGAWLGWMALPLVLLAASLAGILYALVRRAMRGGRGWSDKIPFGPFIAIGIWGAWIVPSAT